MVYAYNQEINVSVLDHNTTNFQTSCSPFILSHFNVCMCVYVLCGGYPSLSSHPSYPFLLNHADLMLSLLLHTHAPHTHAHAHAHARTGHTGALHAAYFFRYYTENGGELISSVNLKDVVAVTEMDKKTFRLATAEPFGASKTHEMVLEAHSPKVKQKWLSAMRTNTTQFNGFSSNRAELIVECYLLKVQPFGTINTTRWFRLTAKKFAYYGDEAGEELGSVCAHSACRPLSKPLSHCCFLVRVNVRLHQWRGINYPAHPYFAAPSAGKDAPTPSRDLCLLY